MTIQALKKLRETEDRIEFKEAKKDFNFAGGSHADPAERRRCVLGYVVALANEGGGYLVFGMKEKRPNEVVGTAFAENEINHVRQGISTGLNELSVEKLQREGLIKSQTSADKKYVLSDLYYEIAQQSAYIKEYRALDLQIIAGCFERATEVSMKDFVEAFDDLLTREQIKTLIYKLEEDELIEKKGGGRSIKYSLTNNFNREHNIFEQFIEFLS